MGEYFYDAIELIHNKYNDDASNIWKSNPNSAQVGCRFLEFNGVGIKIATMAVNILSRDYKVPMTDMSAIDISPDRHVKRCMYRLGLIPERKEHDFLIYLKLKLFMLQQLKQLHLILIKKRQNWKIFWFCAETMKSLLISNGMLKQLSLIFL